MQFQNHNKAEQSTSRTLYFILKNGFVSTVFLKCLICTSKSRDLEESSLRQWEKRWRGGGWEVGKNTLVRKYVWCIRMCNGLKSPSESSCGLLE